MTAETDALRLVRELLALVLLKYGNLDPDVNKLTERAQEFLLAPAVQPAAGRLADAIERVDRWANYAYTFEDTVAVDSPLSTFTAGDLRLILSALAHPPAQGSESGGERLREALEEVRKHFDGDNRDKDWLETERLVRQALSPQPGPAPEGDPAHD